MNIIKKIMLMLLFHCSISVNAQPLQWAFGCGSAGLDRGNSVVVDNSGHILNGGGFNGTVDFDPGPGVFNLTGVGFCAFIRKLDSSGNFVWAKSLTPGGAFVLLGVIETDLANNVYITGRFGGTVDFDPGPGAFNLTSAGQYDIFIMKLNQNGDFIFAKKMGGTSQDIVYSIDLDAQSNIYTTGYYGSTADFDPGPGVFNLTSLGSGDIFLSKLDSNGLFVWAKNIGGSGPDAGHDIQIDNSGNVLYTGYFSNTVDFDPGVAVHPLTSNGAYDIFIAKLDGGGNFVWAKRMGGAVTGNNTEQGNSIALDANNNIYVIGDFRGVADFDPGPGVFNMMASGNEIDIFISKLDSNGMFVWAKSVGSDLDDSGNKILIDNTGEIFLEGDFREKIDLDPGIAVYNLSATNYNGSFITKLDVNGNFLWAKSFAYNGIAALYTHSASFMALQGSSVIMTGVLENTTDMDPGAGVVNLVSNGGEDIFILKYNHCGSDYTFNYSACDSFNLLGNTYTSSCDTVFQYTDINGCDSNQNNHIVIYPTQIIISDTACDSYTYNAQTYNQSGTYTQNSINGPGCQVTTTLNLLINHADTTHYWQQSCIPSYTLNGQTYTNTGVYQQFLTDQTGCDSILILHLNITSCPPCIPDIIITDSLFYTDITESQTWILTSGIVIIPSGSKAKLDAYPDNYVQLNPGFKAEAGSIFVAQAYNGCYAGQPQLPNAKIFTGEASAAADEIILYPNPTTGMIHIRHDEKLSGIQIFDMVGKLVINQNCIGETETNIDLSNLPNGVYHVKAAEYNSIKVVKNN